MVYRLRMNIAKEFIPYYLLPLSVLQLYLTGKDEKYCSLDPFQLCCMCCMMKTVFCKGTKSFNNFFIFKFLFMWQMLAYLASLDVFCGINFLVKKVKIPFSLYRLMSFKPRCSFVVQFFHVTKIGSEFYKVT